MYRVVLKQHLAPGVCSVSSTSSLVLPIFFLFFFFLSSDPHPGNLIRTPEGKLAILDFGLMTQITDNQKFGMIEAISHLVHRDYEGIGDDFKRLDFIPEEVMSCFLLLHFDSALTAVCIV